MDKKVILITSNHASLNHHKESIMTDLQGISREDILCIDPDLYWIDRVRGLDIHSIYVGSDINPLAITLLLDLLKPLIKGNYSKQKIKLLNNKLRRSNGIIIPQKWSFNGWRFRE